LQITHFLCTYKNAVFIKIRCFLVKVLFLSSLPLPYFMVQNDWDSRNNCLKAPADPDWLYTHTHTHTHTHTQMPSCRSSPNLCHSGRKRRRESKLGLTARKQWLLPFLVVKVHLFLLPSHGWLVLHAYIGECKDLCDPVSSDN
jgi:hypothetical protein